MRRINIVLAETMYRDFAARCEYAGTTMAGVVRNIIARELADPRETKDHKPSPAARAHDRRVKQALREEETRRRDDDIMARAGRRETYASIAERYGLTVSGVSRVIERRGGT